MDFAQNILAIEDGEYWNTIDYLFYSIDPRATALSIVDELVSLHEGYIEVVIPKVIADVFGARSYKLIKLDDDVDETALSNELLMDPTPFGQKSLGNLFISNIFLSIVSKCFS